MVIEKFTGICQQMDQLQLRNTKYHNFFNGGEQNRIHLVACVLENPFN